MHSSALCHIETSHVRSVCQAVGTDGFSAVGGEAGHAVHDRFPALRGFSQTGPHVPQTLQGYIVSVMFFAPGNGCLS